MMNIIGAILAIIVGLIIVFWTVGLLLDILGALIVIVGIVLLVRYAQSRRGKKTVV